MLTLFLNLAQKSRFLARFVLIEVDAFAGYSFYSYAEICCPLDNSFDLIQLQKCYFRLLVTIFASWCAIFAS